ncbi:A-kinase-interacting protein 1 isoform X2 [Rhinoderma darwinii]|uniref:A-kinase-interacting protein 1 isoform X2 n=1 Tax=Rhinoderma darwinii TaxID=43563 RepID=UPI003F6652D3
MYGAVTVSRVVRWLRVLYLTGSRTFHLVVCRSHTMEESHMWMEDSLRRTSEIGREVLERARRRDVDWWSAGTPGDRSPRTHPRVETPEEEERPSSLEDAFSTLSRFMRQTTEQCERYHGCLAPQVMSRREAQHVCRFHCRKRQQKPMKPPPGLGLATAPLQSARRKTNPRHVNIEVAPGTYNISAGSPNCQTQTHLVNITPGQSVDLTFHV